MNPPAEGQSHLNRTGDECGLSFRPAKIEECNRLRVGVAKKFSLDLVTIQTIQQELASGQNVDQRPIIRSARQIHRKTLSLLALLGSASEKLTAEDWWSFEFFFNGNSSWTEASFRSAVVDLLAAGIIRKDDENRIEFSGDDLDRIYIKYLARQKGISLSGSVVRFEVLVFQKFNKMLGPYLQFESLGAVQTPDKLDDISELIQILTATEDGPEAMGALSASPWVEEMLAQFLQREPGLQLILYELFVTLRNTSFQIWGFWREPEQKVQLRKLDRTIAEFTERASQVGFSVATRSWTISVPPRDILVRRITSLNNEQIATRLSRNLMGEVSRVYTDERNSARAMELAKTAFQISPSRSVPDANNIGYLYLSHGDYEEAKLWFQAAAQYELDDDDYQLLEYNLGVLAALSGRLQEARDHFNRAKQHTVKSEARCVYQLNLCDGKITSEEVFDPRSLDALAEQAINSLEGI